MLAAFCVCFHGRAAQAQETETILHWKNGDVLPGTLIEINAGQVRWSSSLFSEELIIATKALDSVFFPKQTLQPTEAFRIGTTSGDVFTAELVGSDENTLVFSSKRLGQVRINRGEDLTVRRLRVYRQSIAGVRQPVESGKSRVHLTDGQIVYGQLFVKNGSAYVTDLDGRRQEISLKQLDRIATPGVTLNSMSTSAELIYADGATVRGEIERAEPDQVVLRTAFSETPVICTLAGAASLRFGSFKSEAQSSESRTRTNPHNDQLFCAAGRLRGRLAFDVAESPLAWQPEGAATPLRMKTLGGARVQRNSTRVSKKRPFETRVFPHVLHLRNGEVIPCRVSSYNEATVGLQSPYLEGREISSRHVKGIEFADGRWYPPDEKPVREIDGGFGKLRSDVETDDSLDNVKLERALTVPRFSRENPPSHILVARNGDMKRGTWEGINGEMIEFESKLRKLSVPLNRISRVVNVSDPEALAGTTNVTDEPAAAAETSGDSVRATLSDGSILFFEAHESRDGQLMGRSSIYGDMAIPIDNIEELHFGDFEKEKFRSLFEDWVVRPAKEPESGEEPTLTTTGS